MTKYKDENRGKKIRGRDGRFLYESEFISNGTSDGFIYKNSVAFHEPWRYKNKNEIVYIPEYGFTHGQFVRCPEERLLLHYSRQDLINITNSEVLAVELFDELTWQCPESLWREWCADSEKNGHWIEAQWAYEKVYLPEFVSDVDRKGQEPVCSREFFDVEWKDKEYREYCLNRLTEIGCLTNEEAQKAMGVGEME